MREDYHVITADDTMIENLGPCRIANPMLNADQGFSGFVDDQMRVVLDPFLSVDDCRDAGMAAFEMAGPRKQIYFDPSKLKVAIVTCGGMCPGINSLVRAIVLQCHFMYGVRNVVGVRFGLQGFIPEYNHDLMELNPDSVSDVHGRGGSFLGMSRGSQPIAEVVDALERQNIGLLFMIGGDGTLRAAKAITDEITKRRMKISVVAIPKTIDNDICFVERTFGFQTAVEAAADAILGAHNEATGAPGGIGLGNL